MSAYDSDEFVDEYAEELKNKRPVCTRCDGTGWRVPDDCFFGRINHGSTELHNMVYDCNICPHEQPCMVACECCAGETYTDDENWDIYFTVLANQLRSNGWTVKMENVNGAVVIDAKPPRRDDEAPE